LNLQTWFVLLPPALALFYLPVYPGATFEVLAVFSELALPLGAVPFEGVFLALALAG
jgi:hypothetical protein